MDAASEDKMFRLIKKTPVKKGRRYGSKKKAQVAQPETRPQQESMESGNRCPNCGKAMGDGGMPDMECSDCRRNAEAQPAEQAVPVSGEPASKEEILKTDQDHSDEELVEPAQPEESMESGNRCPMCGKAMGDGGMPDVPCSKCFDKARA